MEGLSSAAETFGVLAVNLGSPEAPTPQAVRRYLAEFLWDRRVVELSRIPWWLILHLFVLPFRPRRSARAYRKIWTPEGSPLLVTSRRLAEILGDRLNLAVEDHFHVEVAMRYGQPAIGVALDKLKVAGVSKVIVLPLYPQYAAATTASIYDAMTATLAKWRHIPSFCFIGDYYLHPGYITAVADSISGYWQQHGKPGHLLFSFHGLPERAIRLGDPYYDQCQTTAKLVADKIGLSEQSWEVVFQSRFGKAEWLKPYCVDVLAALPGRGISRVDVVCPGFAVDCLETLEEIAMTNREVFMKAGGKGYRYIPALNTSEGQVRFMLDLILNHFGHTHSVLQK